MVSFVSQSLEFKDISFPFVRRQSLSVKPIDDEEGVFIIARIVPELAPMITAPATDAMCQSPKSSTLTGCEAKAAEKWWFHV